jgi:hypothetical protein
MGVRAFADYVHDWETPELAAEVHRILMRLMRRQPTTMDSSQALPG